jgi:hypothetical protein
MSEEQRDRSDQADAQNKSVTDIPAGLQQLNDQLERLGQIAQNFAGQNLERDLVTNGGRTVQAAERFAGAEETAAISRARMLRFAQVGEGAAGIAEGAAMGEIGGAIGMLGGPAGIAAMAAVQLGASAIDYVQGTAQDHRMTEAGDRAERAQDKWRLDRLAGPDGTASEAREEAQADRADYVARAGNEAQLQEEATPHWWKLSEFPLWAMNKVFGSDLKTREGQKALEENDAAKVRDLENEARAKQITRKKFTEEEFPLIEAQEKRNAGDERGAKALEDAATWMRSYNQLVKDGADAWQAEQGASAGLEAAQKAEHQARAQSYARLVSARDGAADTARVATLAHDDALRHTSAISLEQLRHDMNRNHAEATHIATRKHFARP